MPIECAKCAIGFIKKIYEDDEKTIYRCSFCTNEEVIEKKGN